MDESRCSNGLVWNFENELEQHMRISKENIKEFTNHIDDVTTLINERLNDERNYGKTLINLKKSNFINEINQLDNELSAQSSATEQTKQLDKLQLELNKLTTKYKNLQADHDNTSKDIQNYLTVLKHMCSLLNYSICKGSRNDDEQRSVKIAFLSCKGEAAHAIEFYFDKKTDCLLDFNVGSLISPNHHKALLKRYQDTGNVLALVSTLRKFVLSKQ